jgi:hypothetical protein
MRSNASHSTYKGGSFFRSGFANGMPLSNYLFSGFVKQVETIEVKL